MAHEDEDDLRRKLAVLVAQHEEIRAELNRLDDQFLTNHEQIRRIQRLLKKYDPTDAA